MKDRCFVARRHGYVLTPANKRRNADARRNSESSASSVQVERKLSSKGGKPLSYIFVGVVHGPIKGYKERQGKIKR